MLISTLILALLAPLSFASSATQRGCVKLLESPSPEDIQIFEPDSVELSKAAEWLNNQGAPSNDEASSRAAVALWKKWSQVTPAARKATLGIELQMLSTPSADNVIAWDNTEKLKKLSAANLQRLIQTLENRYPEAAKLLRNSDSAAKAWKMSQNLRIHYTRPIDLRNNLGVHPPVASPKELAKYKLGLQTQSFYSKLVGGFSPSVDFKLSVTNGNAVEPDSMRLRDDFAASEGFVVPRFESVEELLKFFELWDPAAVERLYKQNRMSLPRTVDSGTALMDYLESGAGEVEEIFPVTAPDRLAVLRTKLSEYILTGSDAEEFVRIGFQLYFLSEASKGQQAYESTSVHNAYRRNFLPFIGWPGISLHVPVSVPTQAYGIFRSDSFRPPTLSDRFSRRLDHDSKP